MKVISKTWLNDTHFTLTLSDGHNIKQIKLPLESVDLFLIGSTVTFN